MSLVIKEVITVKKGKRKIQSRSNNVYGKILPESISQRVPTAGKVALAIY